MGDRRDFRGTKRRLDVGRDLLAIDPLGRWPLARQVIALEASGVPATSGILLALTLEPQPGAKTPTLPIISKGVATGAA